MQKRKDDILKSFGTRENFLTLFNPDSADRFVDDASLCHFGGAPTLAELNTTYGAKTGAMWLIPQLYRLSEYCGVRDKLQGDALKECANTIVRKYHWLNVTEFMLSFARFREGRYGRFYGTVDPLIIVSSIADFCEERANAIDQHEKLLHQYDNTETISWEEYCLRTYGEVKPISSLFDFTNSNNTSK